MKPKHLLAAVAATVMGISSAVAEEWNMPVPYSDAVFHTKNIRQFADDVTAATNGDLTIKVHSAGSLFKHPEIKNAVRSGQVPVGEFLLSRLGNENAVFAVDTLPFLASNYDAASKLWVASRPKVEELLDKQGLQVLFSVPWPPQGLYTKKDVETVEDLKGLSFRAYNAGTETLAKKVGMAPTQVESPDIPQAFATGRVQAMITSPSTGVSSKAWDFLTNYYDTQAWLPKNIVVINKKSFRRLDKATQDAVMAAASAAEKRGWEMSMAETDAKTQTLRDNGVTVSAPSGQLTQELQAIGDEMVADWMESAGDDGRAVIKAYR
ncbi:TRAP transporter substrate-binding protein [Curvivirga aplysinae]|uniref:TRAP transporter substrate-binding protein n=1 Tax=Curvivirga aplysinae TaxID=2529852 RepID=UPI0012BC2524|nr:TRAP transporter substrate-binding protein [Curvivirga aplysinae]MTI09142.1 C4-dicarboxylate ABC transporter substrate-binding protein [Curvivirga aplysinae]